MNRHFNWSRIRTWRRCARQYHYKYIENLARRKPKVTLIRGSIIHEMVDAYVKKENPLDVLEKYSKKYKELFAEEREVYGTLIDDCRSIYERYIDYHESQDITFTHSEVQLRVPLTKTLDFVGTVDKIGVDANKRRWLSDHKTHKSIPGEEARFHDIQLVFYVWMWNDQYPDERVTGVMWDYMRTKLPAVPDLLKSGELSRRENMDTDYETYYQAIEANKLDPDDYREFLDKLKGKQQNFFKRVFLPNPKDELVKQVVDEARLTAMMIEKLESTYKARTLTKDCSWCEFYQLCHAELRGHDASFVRKSEYMQREPEKYDAQESDED